MAWTYQQRIQRASQSFVDRNLLDESQITHRKRPLFFGEYAFSIGFSPLATLWTEFDSLRERIVAGLEGRDYHFTPNRSTMDFHVFSSDVSVLKWLQRNQSSFVFNHLRLVDSEYWTIPLPKAKKKTKFYNLYDWRVTLKDSQWIENPSNRELLEGLDGGYKIMTVPIFYQSPKTFLYLTNKSDVLMFKIMASEHILGIEDRSAL